MYTDLRAQPCAEIFMTDASLSHAGCCSFDVPLPLAYDLWRYVDLKGKASWLEKESTLVTAGKERQLTALDRQLIRMAKESEKWTIFF